jgi:hypothetical protein
LTHRILLANLTLAGRTGTEIVTRDLALGLLRRGHAVQVYSPRIGPVADEVRAAGATVAASVADLHDPPDIIQGNHLRQTLEAVERFRDAPAVFVCHDRTDAHSIPPRHSQVRRYVAVDLNCLERIEQDAAIPRSQTRVIHNAVDLDRFVSRDPLPPTPRRALVFSHYARPGTYVDTIRNACTTRGIRLDVAGSGAGAEVADPERILPAYDVVFAKARCALEAMAVGAAVVLCDADGMGGMVMPAEVQGLREWNFGSRTLREPVTGAGLHRELDRYDAGRAADVSRMIRELASLDTAIDAYVTLHDEVLAEWASAGPAPYTANPVLDVVDALASRVQALEKQHAEFARPERMPALADRDARRLRVTIDDAPASLLAGGERHVRASVDNGTASVTLGSWPPFHLHWSYRWRRPGSTAVFADNARTPIRTPVGPGDVGHAAVKVIAPAEAGRWVLRITLVQERLRWLDEPPLEVFAETEVDVVATGGLEPAGPQPS